MTDIVLYIHILAATVWVGGSIFLFFLGIFLRDKEAQKQVYLHIGPLYGYLESVWHVILIATGLHLFYSYSLDAILAAQTPKDLTYYLMVKIVLVVLITVATIVHMYIAFKTHGKERTKLQLFLSRSSSMAIFLLNLLILWYAIQIRSLL